LNPLSDIRFQQSAINLLLPYPVSGFRNRFDEFDFLTQARRLPASVRLTPEA
jgi:hypothetical protein